MILCTRSSVSCRLRKSAALSHKLELFCHIARAVLKMGLPCIPTIFAAHMCFAFAEDACDHAARRASAEIGVPLSVLWSITRTETGRAKNGRLRPWPWTVNISGTGYWFDTKEAARTFVTKHYSNGARSFDVGCFQVNYKWHGSSFRSIEQMFDPLENARYAATFLRRLYGEFGDWSAAAGAYHSRTPEYANRYKARFDQIRKQHDSSSGPSTNEPDTLASASSRKRTNSYPLLRQSNAAQSAGSLVPLPNGRASALFSISRSPEGS